MTEPREYLIRKNGYFYRPNRSGYTMEKVAAGRYTKAEAEREAAIEPENFTVLHESEVPDADEVVDLKDELRRSKEWYLDAVTQRDRYSKLWSDAQDEVEFLTAENDRLVRNAQTDAWLLAGYHRICERHGIAPSSAELIAAAKEVEDEQLP